MTETEEVFEEMISACSYKIGSGRFKEFSLVTWKIQKSNDSKMVYLYLSNGGCVCINRDGTWGGDIAPFSD